MLEEARGGRGRRSGQAGAGPRRGLWATVRTLDLLLIGRKRLPS